MHLRWQQMAQPTRIVLSEQHMGPLSPCRHVQPPSLLFQCACQWCKALVPAPANTRCSFVVCRDASLSMSDILGTRPATASCSAPPVHVAEIQCSRRHDHQDTLSILPYPAGVLTFIKTWWALHG